MCICACKFCAKSVRRIGTCTYSKICTYIQYTIILCATGVYMILRVHMCMCMYLHVCCAYNNVCIRFQVVYVQNVCMYHVCIDFFACIWLYLMHVYVLHVLAQTSTLMVITCQNDLLLGREHAGPTQGSPGQVPISFNPPSKTPPQTRFGALPRAARGSNSGPECRQ